MKKKNINWEKEYEKLQNQCFEETKGLILSNGNYIEVETIEYVQVANDCEEIYDISAIKVEDGKIYFYNDDYLEDWIAFDEKFSFPVLCSVNQLIKNILKKQSKK